MRSSLLAASFLTTLFLASGPMLLPQQPPASATSPISNDPTRHVSNGPQFQFTKIDNNLLAEADAVDAEYEKEALILHDPGVQAYIDGVGNRILAGRPVPEKVAFRFLVLRDSVVNAYAQANGTVYVTTGLLALIQNEAQLAAVLAHETSHVYDRHPYLENRSIRKKAVAVAVVSIAAEAALASVSGPFAGAAIYAGSRVSSIILVESVYGYSREVESQADRDGIAAMTAAGYDPHAMAATFALFDTDSTLEFTPYTTIYQDHPRLESRRAEALQFAGSNTPDAARTGSEKDYLSAVAPAIVSNINIDLECRRPRTAVARAARLVDALPGDPQFQVLLGESYHALGAKTTQPTPDELTPEGEDKQRKMVLKKTEEQEQERLLRTPEGQATLKQNQAAAENLFLAAIQGRPDYAPAYRELGFLDQDEARYSDAAANYQHYLQLVAPTSLDRYRIERRLSQVQSLQPQQVH